jgi:uncharacterized protein (UPF0332 family)
MDGSEFIEFSRNVSQQASVGPAGYRSSVSRAYYGAFHIARSVLYAFNFYCRDKNSEHRWVQRHFLNCTTPIAVEIGKLLENLHESRKAADYDIHKPQPETKANAEFCVLRADEIKSKLQQCDEPAVKSQIQSEMLNYRVKVRES